MGPNEVLDKGCTADGAVPLFHAVTLTGIENCAVAGAAAFCLGVAQEEMSLDDAERGRVVRVRVIGISRVVAANGTIARNAKVTTNASGQATTATAGQPVLGIALTPSAAAGDWVNVLLTPGVVA